MEPSIRKQLSRLMREKKLSQSALSRATGVPQPTINRILSQTTVDLRRDSVVRIAKYLDVTPESLYSSQSKAAGDSVRVTDFIGADANDVIDEICRRVMTLTSLQRAEVLQRLVELVVVK
ncbi:MAG: helix-turn-helix transcriptional regulator [Porticoccaceae bacterium]|nr:helix-turn-helix transcriptional regulator [Porticoccaceae bacterium]